MKTKTETGVRLARGREGSRRLEIPRRHYLGQRAGGSLAAGAGGGKAYVHQIHWVPDTKHLYQISTQASREVHQQGLIQ